jgi:hypothetical protein
VTFASSSRLLKPVPAIAEIVHENILAAVVVGYKPEALIRIKPFYRTAVHRVPPNY